MTRYERSDEDYQPLAWFRGYPIHATHLIIILHVAILVIGSLLKVILDNPAILDVLGFSTEAVLQHYSYWQIFTYAFGNQLEFGFIISLAMLYLCGWELERFLGRRVFLSLYGALVLTTPLVLLARKAILHEDSAYFMGATNVHFGVFIAFATVYPNAEFFFRLLAKWIAWVLVAFYSLFYLSVFRKFPTFLPLFWATVIVGHVGMRYAGAAGGLPFVDRLKERFSRRSKLANVQTRFKPRRLVESNAAVGNKALPARSIYATDGELHESINPLLDKISKHGLASLTHSERAALERARVSLLRKDREG